MSELFLASAHKSYVSKENCIKKNNNNNKKNKYMNEEATTILPRLAGKMVKYCPLPGPNRLQLGEFGPLASLEVNDLV